VIEKTPQELAQEWADLEDRFFAVHAECDIAINAAKERKANATNEAVAAGRRLRDSLVDIDRDIAFNLDGRIVFVRADGAGCALPPELYRIY
jgi:hypothetical protein